MIKFDEVLGLNLAQTSSLKTEVPDEIKELLKQRDELRQKGQYQKADEIRKQIESKGFKVMDKTDSSEITS